MRPSKWLVVGLLLVGMMGTVSADTGGTDGFEDGEWQDDWNKPSVTSGEVYVRNTPPLNGDHYLELVETGAGGGADNIYIERNLNNIAPEKLEICVSEEGSANNMGIDWNNNGNRVADINVRVGNNEIRVQDQIIQNSATQGKTYCFELKNIDWNNNEIGEVYINGNLEMSNVAFLNSADHIDEAEIMTAGNGYYDDITVREYNLPPSIDSVSTDPMNWTLNSNVDVSANVSDSDGSVSSVTADVYENGTQIKNGIGANYRSGETYGWTDLINIDKSEVTYKYELTATDDDGATSTYSESREVDFTAPRLELFKPESPTNTRTGLPLNYTVSDPHLDTSSCKYSKDGGTNFTLSNCNNASIDFGTVGNHNLTVYASDTYNNTDKAFKSLFVDEVNEIRAEDQESGSPIQEFSVTLDNGTDTIGGTAFNNTFNFNTSNVPKGDVNLTLKTSGYQVQTFQLNTDDSFSLNKTYELERSSITVNALDEQDLSEVKFDLEASNGTTVFDKDNLSSFSKDYRDFNGNFPTGDVTITIKASNGDYRLRNYYTEIDENSVISLTSYLLKKNEGIPVTLETYTQDQETLSGVMLTAQKQINGDYKQVSQEITSSDGSGSFFLDPDYQYKLIASKTGYSTFEGTFSPANYQYDPLKVQLGTGGRFNFSTRWETIDYKLEPQGRFLNQTDNKAEISWTVNDLKGDLSEFGIRLKNKTGGLIKTEYIKTSPSGGQVNLTINGSKYPSDQVFNVEGYFISSGDEFRVEKQYSFEKQWESGIFSLDKILGTTGNSLDSSQKGFIALIITGLIGAGFGSRLEKEGAGLIVLAVLGMFTVAGWFPPAIFILSVFTLMGVYFR